MVFLETAKELSEVSGGCLWNVRPVIYFSTLHCLCDETSTK